MARRRGRDTTALGLSVVALAYSKIAEALRRSVALQVDYPHDRDYTIRSLFDPEALEKVRVRDLVRPLSWYDTYEIRPGVGIRINWTESPWVTVNSGAHKLQGTASELLAVVDEIEKIYLAYEEVKTVLGWLNTNATASAIRYYWPSAMQLAPAAGVWNDLREVPKRYTTPVGLDYRMPMLRRSAATVAAMALIPSTAKPKQTSDVAICFSSRPIVAENGIRYNTDSVTLVI